MTTIQQRNAAKENIQKAQQKWKSMTHREHARSQPQGRGRKKPGTTGKGKFFRIVVRPKEQFMSFRIQDVGRKGHLERLSGHRASGTWATQAWLVSKKDAHLAGEKLIADSSEAKKLFRQLATKPHHEKGDIFTAKDRRNVLEAKKPTRAMKQAQHRNIKKAQQARKKNQVDWEAWESQGGA